MNINPSSIIKIECTELPEDFSFGEGSYELRRGDKPKEIFYYDVTTLSKEIKQIMPGREDDVLSRLQNFRRAYLNLDTGEITS
jgi:hypothetical protein